MNDFILAVLIVLVAILVMGIIVILPIWGLSAAFANGHIFLGWLISVIFVVVWVFVILPVYVLVTFENK